MLLVELNVLLGMCHCAAIIGWTWARGCALVHNEAGSSEHCLSNTFLLAFEFVISASELKLSKDCLTTVMSEFVKWNDYSIIHTGRIHIWVTACLSLQINSLPCLTRLESDSNLQPFLYLNIMLLAATNISAPSKFILKSNSYTLLI